MNETRKINVAFPKDDVDQLKTICTFKTTTPPLVIRRLVAEFIRADGDFQKMFRTENQ